MLQSFDWHLRLQVFDSKIPLPAMLSDIHPMINLDVLWIVKLFGKSTLWAHVDFEDEWMHSSEKQSPFWLKFVTPLTQILTEQMVSLSDYCATWTHFSQSKLQDRACDFKKRLVVYRTCTYRRNSFLNATRYQIIHHSVISYTLSGFYTNASAQIHDSAHIFFSTLVCNFSCFLPTVSEAFIGIPRWQIWNTIKGYEIPWSKSYCGGIKSKANGLQ